jgi:uncharacterized membrane protein YdbT with pleckstrin-like domain
VAFPKKLLTSDEELVLDLRPHWIALVPPVFVTILLIAAVIVAYSQINGNGTLKLGILAAAVLLFLIYPVRWFIRWVTSHFVVTNERLIHRAGLIAKKSMEVPLNRINDVRFEQNVFERMIGAGDLIIESAGTQGQEVFEDVRHPEEVQKVIYERSEAYQARGSFGHAAHEPSMTEELQRLADLKDRGAITEAEYEAQKARLLGAG